MMRKTLFVFSFLACCTVFGAFAQTATKCGHTNLGNLLEMMPESKKADEELKAFTQKLVAKGDSLGKIFEAEVADFQKHYQAGDRPMVELQKTQQELQAKQEALQKFDRESQEEVAKMRDKMLNPLLDKAKAAIKSVAISKGYSIIFDTSGGSMLFAADSDDVTALVKQALGIQ